MIQGSPRLARRSYVVRVVRDPARREREREILTQVRDRLVAKMRQLNLSNPGDVPAPHEVTCRLHGEPWRSCSQCSLTKDN